MGITDIVAAHILKMLEEENGIAEIQRNELAGIIGCVPSQINYVISSRFTPEQGYVVESRRGGGGYIRITRSFRTKPSATMHIINSVGDRLDISTIRVMLHNMYYNELITKKEANVIGCATSDRTLIDVPKEIRDVVRASIFKNLLLVMKSE